MGQSFKSTRQLILDLQDAGITNEYCNIILNAIHEEQKTSFAAGKKVGHSEFRGVLLKECKASENFNTQYLTDWATNIKIK